MAKRPQQTPLEPVVRNPSQLGASLLRFRKLVPWTQQQTGEQAGIKQSMVSEVESGSPGTSLGTLFRLLAGLDLELIVRRRKKSPHQADT